MQFESPDLRYTHNYTTDRLPQTFHLSLLKPAKRFLRLIRERSAFEFLRTKAEFETSDDDRWMPLLHLGEGGWGEVGCWAKKDEEGTIIDRVAIKQVREPADRKERERLNSLRWDDTDVYAALLEEAVIQRQLNRSLSENIVHLRGYKFFRQKPPLNLLLADDKDPPVGTRRWRFYLELVPHGDLDDLSLIYRYYRNYLPEAFLWHVFDSLAEAASKMRDCDTHTDVPHRSQGVQASDQVVNFDIKPANILLGRPRPLAGVDTAEGATHSGTTKYNYPVIKLGDYGLAHFTGSDGNDKRNPWGYVKCGTSGHQAPDVSSTRNEIFLIPEAQRQDRSPFYRTEDADNDSDSNNDKFMEGAPHDRKELYKHKCLDLRFKFTEKLHVWAIGKVVYDLMCLKNSGYYWDISTDSYAEFKSNGQHQVPEDDQRPFEKDSHTGTNPYSDELTKLVWDCLRPLAPKRMDVARLKERTEAGMQTWDDQWYAGCEEEMPEDASNRGVDHPKLFYEHETLNDMPEGPELFRTVFGVYVQVRKAVEKEPDMRPWNPKFDREDPEFPPHTHQYMWDTAHSALGTKEKTAFQKEFRVVNGELRRKSEPGVGVMETDSSSSDDNNEGDGGTEDGGSGGVVTATPTKDQTATADNGASGMDHHNASSTTHEDTTMQDQNNPVPIDTALPADTVATTDAPAIAPTPAPGPVPTPAPAPVAPPANGPNAAVQTATQATQPNTTREPRMTAGLGIRKASIKTDDPSDSEYEIVVRELGGRNDKDGVHREVRRKSYYRLRPGRREDKRKLKRKNLKAKNFARQGRSKYNDARRRNGEDSE